MSDKIETVRSVKTCIETFCQALDVRDWSGLKKCLAATVFADYSSFRGTKPGNISSEEYIELRKKGLHDLITKHSTNNFQITPGEFQATCHCDFVIQRFGQRGKYFHSYGHYLFLLSKIKSAWKISSVKQVVIRSEGDASIHGAFQME